MALNRPDLFVGVAFNADPFDTLVTPTWTDLTARCLGINSAKRGRQYELDRNQNGSLDATWINIDEALNPVNTGSPYSPNVVPYRQILARCMWPNSGGGPLNANTGFESGLVDWVQQSGWTIVQSSSFAHTGTWSMRMTPPGAVAVGGAITIARYQVLPNTLYTASAWFSSVAGWSDARACIDWYDNNNVFISTGIGAATVVPAGSAWTQSSQLLVSPAGAAWANLRARQGGTPAATDVLYVDDVQLLAGVGNLLNLVYNGTDASFESYTNGAAAPSWLTRVGGVVPTVTTTTPQQGTQCVTYTVAASATVQGLSWTVPCIPGRQYTASGYVRQSTASTQQISVTGIATGTSTTTTGAYVRLVVTFTATQPTHTVQLATTGTALAGTVLVDALQHEPGGSVSAFTTSGPLIRNVWTRGYVERWPQEWTDNGYRGISSTPCVGPFAILANADMHTEYRGAVMAKAPTYYHPLQEAQGATAFADVSGNGAPPLVRYISTAGAGTAYVAGSTAAAAGDPGGVGVKFVPSANNRQGSFIAAGFNATGSPNPVNIGVPPLPTTSGGFWSATWAGLVQANAVTYTDSSGALMILWHQAGGTAFAGPFYIVVLNSGAVQATIHGHGADVTAVSSTVITDGAWHHILITASQDVTNSTITLYIDGVLAATATTATATVQLFPDQAQCYAIGVITAGGSPISPLDGTISHPGMWYRTLSPAEIADLAAAARGYAGETSGARIQRYLALGGYTGPASIQAGASTMGSGTAREGDALLDSCQRVNDSEFGNFFESADGVAFAGRFDRYLKIAAVYTFGERVDLGEYPYEGGIAFDIDPTLVLNIADITRTGGIKAHSEDAASQKRYGKKNFSRTVDTASDNETVDAATWVVASRKAPLNRVAAVTFNAAGVKGLPFGDGTLWPMLLNLEIGTRVAVKRRPKSANAGAGITMSGDFFVESIDHHDIDFEAGTWKTTVELSPVQAAQPWILQDATYGLLDQTTVLGF